MGKKGNIHPTRIFKTPEDLKKVWNDYKADLKKKESEWLKVQYVGKEGERVEDSLKLPLTFEGLKRYCWDVGIGTIEQYFKNQDDDYQDFLQVCRAIKNEIRENQITGGLLNVYNSSITQRLNGLVDKNESKVTEDVTISFKE